MDAAQIEMITTRVSPLVGIVAGGATAATLDILYAFIAYGMRGVTPLRNLQSIAAGVMGRAAYKGGYETAALGLFLHYAILIVAAALLYMASRRLDWIAQHAIRAGLIYGACIYAFMNLVVVPLSAFPYKLTFDPFNFSMSLLVHMVFVGLPIALFVRAASVPMLGARTVNAY
jgi:hypothetical protein